MMRKLEQIAPDDVLIEVAWDKWDVGQSVFVPCLKAKDATKQMHEIARYKGVRLTSKICVENGLFGVRFWRTT